MCRPLDARTLGPGCAGSQSTGEGPQGAMMGFIIELFLLASTDYLSNSRYPSSSILAFLAAAVAAWSRYDTRGTCTWAHFIGNLVTSVPSSETFFHHLSWQAGRQGRAGQDGLSSRQAGGIIHCDCLSCVFLFFAGPDLLTLFPFLHTSSSIDRWNLLYK
jgi:hypothetical protein